MNNLSNCQVLALTTQRLSERYVESTLPNEKARKPLFSPSLAHAPEKTGAAAKIISKLFHRSASLPARTIADILNHDSLAHVLKFLSLKQRGKVRRLSKEFCALVNIKSNFWFVIEKRILLRDVPPNIISYFGGIENLMNLPVSFSKSDIGKTQKITRMFDEMGRIHFIFQNLEKEKAISILSEEQASSPKKRDLLGGTPWKFHFSEIVPMTFNNDGTFTQAEYSKMTDFNQKIEDYVELITRAAK